MNASTTSPTLTQSDIPFVRADTLQSLYIPVDYIRATPQYSVTDNKMKAKDNIHCLMVESFSYGKTDDSELDNLIYDLKALNHPGLYNIDQYSYEFQLDPETKERYWKIYFLYEGYNLTLENYIANKINLQVPGLGPLKGSRFSEIVVISFIEKVISLCAYLEELKIPFNTIHPQNFLWICAENESIIKFNAIRLGQFKTLNYDIEETLEEFKSPEELKSYASPTSSRVKVFHLGMLLIRFMSLQSVHGLNTNKKALSERIKDLGIDYSKYLVELLKKMLTFDQNNRPDFVELNQFVRNFGPELKKDIQINQTSPKKFSMGQELAISPIKIRRQPKEDKFVEESIPRIVEFATNDNKSDNQSVIMSSPSYEDAKEEKIFGAPSLLFNYSPYKPIFKNLHMFIEGTKNFALVSLKQLTKLFVEVFPLDISFDLPENHASIHAGNDRYYIIGGKQRANQKSNCYYYIAGQNTLVEEKSFKESFRIDPGVVSIGPYIFVMGGSQPAKKLGHRDVRLKTCEMFNTETGEWREAAKMNFGNVGALYCSYNGEYIYKIGGIDEQGLPCNDMEKYNLQTDKWIVLDTGVRKSQAIIGRGVIGLQINNDEIFILGGVTEDGETEPNTYVLTLKQREKCGEYITFINKHGPRVFKVGELRQNQIFVMKDQIVFLSLIGTDLRVCSFDGKMWKEIKSFDRSDDL